MIKNVVIISDFPYIEGGSGAVVVDTAYLLAQNGLNVYSFAGEGTPDPRLTASSKIKIISTGQKHILYDKNRFRAFVNGIYNLRAARALKDLLGTLDPDQTVVHVHSWTRVLSPSVFKAALDMGFRVFITIHDYQMVCPTAFFYDYRIFLRLSEAMYLRNHAHVPQVLSMQLRQTPLLPQNTSASASICAEQNHP